MILLSLSISDRSSLHTSPFVVPTPEEHAKESFHTYVKVKQFHEKGDKEWSSKSIKVKDRGEGYVDVMWNGSFEWDIWEDEIAFLRYAPPSPLPRIHLSSSFKLIRWAGSWCSKTSISVIQRWSCSVRGWIIYVLDGSS